METFGFGRQKPHHYLEMAVIAWQNRDQGSFSSNVNVEPKQGGGKR